MLPPPYPRLHSDGPTLQELLDADERARRDAEPRHWRPNAGPHNAGITPGYVADGRHVDELPADLTRGELRALLGQLGDLRGEIAELAEAVARIEARRGGGG